MRNNLPVYPYKVSILIPTYNCEKYIGEAIESVLHQTYRNFECLIADDGSTDHTIDIIRSYSKKDKRIKWYSNTKNLKCSGNINFLILQSKGEYVKILIQDDVLHKDYIKNCLEILERNPDVGIVTSFQKMIGEDNKIRGGEAFPSVGLIEGRKAQRLLLKNGNWIGGETAVMIRRVCLASGLWNLSWDWTVDRDMWMRILNKWNLYVIDKILTYPRVHSGQATVYLNKNFRFIKEELMQLKTAFLFPEIYGIYTKNEKKEMYVNQYISLINQGFQSRELKNVIKSIEIGFEYGKTFFLYVFLKTIIYKLIHIRKLH